MFHRPNLRSLPDHLRWRCETVAQGTEVTAIIAGLPVPVVTHWDIEKGQTKPCLFDVTAGGLTCPCRYAPMKSQRTVYTPFITRDGEKIVIPASERVGEKLMEFNPGKLLTLARPKKRCAGLKIIIPPESDQTQAWVKRTRPTCIHDIEEYLMHLWQIPALNKHFGVPFRPAVGMIVEKPAKGNGE